VGDTDTYYMDKSGTTFDINKVALTLAYLIEGEEAINEHFETWTGKEKSGTWVKLGSDDAQGVAALDDYEHDVISLAEAMGDSAFTYTAQIVFASALCLAAF